MRLVRDFAPLAEERRPAAIHVLRLNRGVDGEVLDGEIPDGIEAILLEGHLFRDSCDGRFRRVEQGGLLRTL